jgi:hypothetical protein
MSHSTKMAAKDRPILQDSAAQQQAAEHEGNTCTMQHYLQRYVLIRTLPLTQQTGLWLLLCSSRA